MCECDITGKASTYMTVNMVQYIDCAKPTFSNQLAFHRFPLPSNNLANDVYPFFLLFTKK